MTDALSINIKGLDSLKKKLKDIPGSADKAVMAGLFIGGLKIESDAKESLRHRGSGVIYKRRGVEHQASAPGEPPSSDTGGLMNSIHTVVNKADQSVEVRAGGGAKQIKHAIPLEFGTSKMAERPFMRPALIANKKNIQDAVETKIQKALADGTR